MYDFELTFNAFEFQDIPEESLSVVVCDMFSGPCSGPKPVLSKSF